MKSHEFSSIFNAPEVTLRLVNAPHANYSRFGPSLLTVVEVSVDEAKNGFKREWTHVDGEKVTEGPCADAALFVSYFTMHVVTSVRRNTRLPRENSTRAGQT